MIRTRNTFGRVWSFETKRFTVALELERERGYRYDGDDEEGCTQRKLDRGEFVAFNSKVVVELDGEEIAANYLGGSVYDSDKVSEFFTDHRTSPPEYRNTLEAKAKRVSYCHYFPGMVSEAIAEARAYIRDADDFPYIRPNAA